MVLAFWTRERVNGGRPALLVGTDPWTKKARARCRQQHRSSRISCCPSLESGYLPPQCSRHSVTLEPPARHFVRDYKVLGVGREERALNNLPQEVALGSHPWA